MDALVMLQELLEQDQFELILSDNKDKENQELRLVYLMNDAVESFLVFYDARMTGEYKNDYEGELESSLSYDDEEYILVVRQRESVVTIFFKDIGLEVHLYDYGEIGHFWMKKYEYLRQLEYRIAILRDKLQYLGEEYCTSEEQKLASLADFPPLNYCCYPAVPEKYIVPREDAWIPSEEAIDVMEKLAEEAKDYSLKRILWLYRRFKSPIIAKKIANMLHRKAHSEVTDLIAKKLKQAAAVYQRRSFGKEMDLKCEQMLEKAKERQKELKAQGKKSVLLREEPFVSVKDGIDFQVHLMIWKNGIVNRKVEVESYGKGCKNV